MMLYKENECYLPLLKVLELMIEINRKAVALDRLAAFAKRMCTLALYAPVNLSLSLLYPIIFFYAHSYLTGKIYS